MPKPNTSDRRIWLLITATAIIAALFIPFSQLVLHVNTTTPCAPSPRRRPPRHRQRRPRCFAVLRRQSLLGDALSHAALPGVAIAFLLAGRDLGLLLIGAGVTSWLGVWFIRLVTGTTRIKQDAAMGIVLAAWFAAGIALLVYIQARPDASQAGLAALVPAALLGMFVEQALPSGSLRILGTLTLAAVLAALTFGSLRMLQGTALMRLEGRAAARASAALWDPYAGPAVALLPPVHRRGTGDPRHGLSRTARPGVGRRCRGAVVGGLPAAHPRVAVPLRR